MGADSGTGVAVAAPADCWVGVGVDALDCWVGVGVEVGVVVTAAVVGVGVTVGVEVTPAVRGFTVGVVALQSLHTPIHFPQRESQQYNPFCGGLSQPPDSTSDAQYAGCCGLLAFGKNRVIFSGFDTKKTTAGISIKSRNAPIITPVFPTDDFFGWRGTFSTGGMMTSDTPGKIGASDRGVPD